MAVDSSKLVYQLGKLDISDAEAREIEMELAELVASRASEYVPVRTGKLRGTIRVEQSASGVEVIAGNDEVDYALPVEFGTSKMAAQPFMRRAAEGSTGDIEKKAGSLIEAHIRKAI